MVGTHTQTHSPYVVTSFGTQCTLSDAWTLELEDNIQVAYQLVSYYLLEWLLKIVQCTLKLGCIASGGTRSWGGNVEGQARRDMKL